MIKLFLQGIEMMILMSMALLAYGLGSVSTGVLISRAFHLPDPRSQGSRNPGATNVLRVGGKWPALFTLLGDVFKGALPVGVVLHGMGSSAHTVGCVMLAAFLGHLYPIFFKFQGGGKGVATALGGLIALSSCLGLSVIAIWISSVLVFRISSLASLVTAFLAPVVAWILLEPTYAGYVMIMSGFLIMRHHQNIKRLWRGEEPRLW